MNKSDRDKLHTVWHTISDACLELGKMWELPRDQISRNEKSFLNRALTELNEAQDFIMDAVRADPDQEYKPIIYPDQFAKDIEEILNEHEHDPAQSHEKMDQYIEKLLKQWGYGEGVEIMERSTRWYE